MNDSLDTLMREIEDIQERAHAAWAKSEGHPDEKALAAIFDGLLKTTLKVKVLSMPDAAAAPKRPANPSAQQDFLLAPFARQGGRDA